MTDDNFDFVMTHENKILCRDGGADFLSLFIDDDFFEISSNASLQTKQDILNWISYGDGSIRTAKNFRSRYIADNVIHLTYITYIKESALTAVKSSYRSSIWKKVDNTWRLSFHQSTPCQ